jgi:hypothetical protein
MDVLTLNGKNYVKASVIARDLGYTADYVGQLCRGGKVDAKLFGRSWYVHKDSIGDHKSTRYRSTQAKTAQAVRVHIEESVKESPKLGVLGHSQFYRHSTQKAVPRYIADEAPLMPSTAKIGSLTVSLADAKGVAIDSSDARYTFTAPKLPVVSFKGKLHLEEYDEATETKDAEEKEGVHTIHPKEVTKFKSENKAHNKAISAEKQEVKHVHKHLKEHEIEVVAIETPYTTKRVFTENTLVVPSYRLGIIASTVVSLVFVLLLLGLESHTSVSGQTVVTTYSFEIDAVTASVSNAFPKHDSPLTIN